MTKDLRLLAILYAVIALYACQTAPTDSLSLPDLPPTPHVLVVAHTPALRPWRFQAVSCASAQPAIGLQLEEIAPGVLPSDVDAVLRYGLPDPPEGHNILLGYERLQLAVNQSSPLERLDENNFAKLFAGKEISPTLNTTLSQIWVYPPGDELELILRPLLPEPAANFRIILDPQELLDNLTSDPASIGFLPESWLDNNQSIKRIELPETLTRQLELPVIANTPSEPQGELKLFLACLSK